MSGIIAVDELELEAEIVMEQVGDINITYWYDPTDTYLDEVRLNWMDED